MLDCAARTPNVCADGDCSAPINLASVESPYTSMVTRKEGGDLDTCYGTRSFFVVASYPLNPRHALELYVYIDNGYVELRIGGECPGTSTHGCGNPQSMSGPHFSVVNQETYVLQVYIIVSSYSEDNPYTLEWNILQSGVFFAARFYSIT